MTFNISRASHRRAVHSNVTLLVMLIAAGSLSICDVRAQFSNSSQTVIISGVYSNWEGPFSGYYFIGFSTHDDTLIIENGGVLSNSATGVVGTFSGDDNNLALVTGSGSVWYNGGVDTGSGGSGNQVIVTNGGQIICGAALSNVGNPGSNNVVMITGTGSVWTNKAGFNVGGANSSGNQLFVTGGGKLINSGCILGYGADGHDNLIVVEGAGSVWHNGGELRIGEQSGSNNRFIVTNGASVFNGGDSQIGVQKDNNVVIVTGTGSVWSNASFLSAGYGGSSNQLFVTDGGVVVCSNGFLGANDPHSSSNVVTVTGNGSRWESRLALYVGGAGPSNTLNIVAGGSVSAGEAYVGYGADANDNQIHITGGSLSVTNDLAINHWLYIHRGTLEFDGGNIVVDQLRMNFGPSGAMVFNSGVLNAGGASVSNDQQFVVGDGTGAATYHLLGGVHSFNDGLRIRNNATLTGCGTIEGGVIVDAGGTVLADCAGTLTFTGSLTNNGTMKTSNGSVLEVSGPLVNNGLIDSLAGTVNFPGGLVNNGTVADAASFRIVNVTKEGSDLRVSWATLGGHSYVVQAAAGTGAGSYSNNFTDIGPTNAILGSSLSTTNYLDAGGATNSPARYYRVRLVP